MAKSKVVVKKEEPKALMSPKAIDAMSSAAIAGVKKGDEISGGAVLNALQTLAKSIAGKRASIVDASNFAVSFDAKWRVLKGKPKGEMNNSLRTGFIAVARIGEKPWHVEAFKRLAALHDMVPIAPTTLGHLGRWMLELDTCPSAKSMQDKRVGINNLANGLKENGKKRKPGEKGKRGKKISLRVRMQRAVAALRGASGFDGYSREMGPHIARMLTEGKAVLDILSSSAD
jgi:hypothetical protein